MRMLIGILCMFLIWLAYMMKENAFDNDYDKFKD